jgi:hypothetical protein
MWYCLAFVSEGGEQSCPDAVGMIVVVVKDPGALLVDGYRLECYDRRRTWGKFTQ